MNGKTVKVTIKNVYGNELIYPVNRPAKLFANLTGKKTFDETDLETIKALEFKIELCANYNGHVYA